MVQLQSLQYTSVNSKEAQHQGGTNSEYLYSFVYFHLLNLRSDSVLFHSVPLHSILFRSTPPTHFIPFHSLPDLYALYLIMQSNSVLFSLVTKK